MSWNIKKTAFVPVLVLLTACVVGCATTGTETKQWSFNQPVIGGGQDAGGGAASRNTLTLNRKLGSSVGTMKIAGSITDTCLPGTLDVNIEQTSDALVLLPVKPFATCYETRITIRNDGTGGYVERRGYKMKEFAQAWPDFNWGLQPR
jgi:hypothetical protein